MGILLGLLIVRVQVFNFVVGTVVNLGYFVNNTLAEFYLLPLTKLINCITFLSLRMVRSVPFWQLNY